MADSYLCRDCSKVISATKNNRYRTHYGKDGERCEASSVDIPADLLEQGPVNKKAPAEVPVKGQDFETCPSCGKNVKLTRLGYFEPHNTTLYGGDRCPASGVRAFHSRKVEDVTLPGDELPEKGVIRAQVPEVSNQLEINAAPTVPTGIALEAAKPTTTEDSPTPPEKSESTLPVDTEPARTNLERQPMEPSPESTSTSSSSETSSAGSEPEGTSSSSSESPKEWPTEFRQPGSPFLQPPAVTAEPAPDMEGTSVRPTFLQPPEYGGPVKAEPMSERAKIIATQIKETFYSYSNRKTSDNRSAQTTLGPSEIGTPCDRRLAMALLGVVPVNPGGDGWAAFVGTHTHEGMAKVYTFADAGTGRYAVELPVFLGMPTVPRGTTDLLDRRDAAVIDWKVMGAYSLKKFKEEGPSQTYRTQAHVYGLGAERAGEKVREVVVVGLPRAGSSLDEMHVWVEKFDRKFAQAALDRVEKIANRIGFLAGQVAATSEGPASPMEAAQTFEAADDCRYCQFHLKNDKEMKRGCPGK